MTLLHAIRSTLWPTRRVMVPLHEVARALDNTENERHNLELQTMEIHKTTECIKNDSRKMHAQADRLSELMIDMRKQNGSAS